MIVPTLNESGNIVELKNRLETALQGIQWEVIFVDDHSADGTQDKVVEIAQTDFRVRLIERIGRRGLAAACIEGMLSSTAPYVAVMDADLQHDEVLLGRMLHELKTDKNLDIVVGSRFTNVNRVTNRSGLRSTITLLGGALSHLVLPRNIQDPMSGFFMLRRDLVLRNAAKLSGRGFKILVDLLSSAGRDCNIKEIPYQFGNRHTGDSKLNSIVLLEFAALIVDKIFGHVIPIRFLLFILMGLFGLGVHIVVLSALYTTGIFSFVPAQIAAALMAMSVNFVLNNIITYRDQRLHGWHLFRGVIFFYLFCSFGLAINMAIAVQLFQLTGLWFVAGSLGGVFGAVWNYSTNTTLTRRIERR